MFKSIFWKFGGFSVVRSSHKLRSNLAVFLTLNILTPLLVKTPIFWEMLLGSTQSATQNLDVLAVVILKIWSHEIRSNFPIFLTLSISTPFLVHCFLKTPNFRETLLGSSQSATQTLDAIAVVVQEISCHKLMPNLAVFLTLSMSTPFQLRLQTLGNVAKFKSKYRVKFGCPSWCILWDIDPWIKFKFSFFSNFKHF